MKEYYSEIVYGGVDGLITTFAIIAGSLGGNLSKSTILILGLASILSDGFSMGVSSYLAENARVFKQNAFIVAIITFLSFVIIGVFPLIPFLFRLKNPFFLSSVILSLLLFLLGFIKDYKLIGGIETLFIGGIAAIIAYYTAKSISNIENRITKTKIYDKVKKDDKSRG